MADTNSQLGALLSRMQSTENNRKTESRNRKQGIYSDIAEKCAMQHLGYSETEIDNEGRHGKVTVCVEATEKAEAFYKERTNSMSEYKGKFATQDSAKAYFEESKADEKSKVEDLNDWYDTIKMSILALRKFNPAFTIQLPTSEKTKQKKQGNKYSRRANANDALVKTTKCAVDGSVKSSTTMPSTGAPIQTTLAVVSEKPVQPVS